jgi:L-amino acid N-acyltransferase YncA
VLRPVTVEDADLIFLWRNDPATRAASFDTAEKTRESFLPAFEKWRRNDPIAPHLVAFEGEDVAFLRFSAPHATPETDEKTLEISIHVAPKARQRGHGKAALDQGARMAKSNGWRKLLALVKAANVVSQRLFSAAGYQERGLIKVRAGDRAPGESAKIYVLAV